MEFYCVFNDGDIRHNDNKKDVNPVNPADDAMSDARCSLHTSSSSRHTILCTLYSVFVKYTHVFVKNSEYFMQNLMKMMPVRV